jgi:hypothetical protein
MGISPRRFGLFPHGDFSLILQEALIGELLVAAGAMEGEPLGLAAQGCEITSLLDPLVRGGTLLQGSTVFFDRMLEEICWKAVTNDACSSCMKSFL